MRAVDFGSLEAVKILVERGAGLEVRREGAGKEGGKRALHIACREGKPEIAEFLVSSGAELEAVTDIGITPLYYAAQAGETDLVIFLLRRGADAHAKGQNGRTPIFNAIGNGHRDVVELLLDHGARVNKRNKLQENPLFYTAVVFDGIPRDYREIAELLISGGADVNARDVDGWTVLHMAAWMGVLGVLEALLANGANIHTIANSGLSALHCVAFLADSEEIEHGLYEKKLRIAELLVSRGIDVDALDEAGNTALGLVEHDQPADSPLLAFLWGLAPVQEEQEVKEDEEEEDAGEEEDLALWLL
uniref:Uncharacterized protein n=1 Tax=Chromera velia CCMP2878 TaxID=1169474 RepID=A0A0G4HFC2_9ALVE|eukprot:Cvel_988.t1-p1 / transcript=Cvel_988.t1 / gene=Cvel_988 / organism=Chromera_velia_CCMP2878 / gene_product=Putative ankyrin repeat protein RF_0381, putative / transcript_product=Putative ankyrin repeat protein RF_0381, putative / location=Cvel_scaffold32:51215-52123(+) / protein_length=303 / sequence_SO=supercontig / SO=protein_coding / is_pseudo=false